MDRAPARLSAKLHMAGAHPYTPTRGGGGQAPPSSWGYVASSRCVIVIVIVAAAICGFLVHATLVGNVHIKKYMPLPARLLGTGNDTGHELVANLTQLAHAALSPKWKTIWGEGWNSTASVTGRLQTIVPPAPKAQVDHRRLSADQRKEASPRIRTQGMIDSKEIGNLTELAVDEIMKWSGYRLGDIMRYWRRDFLSWRGTGRFKPSRVDNPGSVCRRWPASLGCLFLNFATSRVSSQTKRDREIYKDRRQREKIFTDILVETVRGQGKDIPSSDTVVVHVRLSDVLTRDNCWDLPPCVWRGLNGARRIYVYPISWYDTVVQEIRNINTTLKVVVVGHAYHGENRKKIGTQRRRSIEYRTRIVEYFKDHGFNASARPEHLPDDDFLYMTNSKFFVSGGGGFSEMIAEICRSHGGQVFSVPYGQANLTQSTRSSLLHPAPASKGGEPIHRGVQMSGKPRATPPRALENSTTCALLFFGLPKRFKDIVLPSIRKHILHINPGCHIFLHTYNVSTVTNPRNQEREAPLDPNEVFLFKEATRIFVENVDDFHRQQNLTKFRQYFPHRKGWVYPTSLDNMIKQWHSICQAWKIMVVHEERRRSNNTVGEFRYERVGMFRSDVLYVNDIDIMDGDATTTLFNNNPRYMSDRLFYGIRKHSKRWACGRFEHVKDYMETKFGQVNRLHSENFLFHLMGHWRVPMQYRDICVQRVRATGRIQTEDCNILKKSPSWKHDYSLMNFTDNGKNQKT
jgi:hypothetical protein